ncbi:hypothetical protein [Williamsia maris]|uniref:Uncharacterized protein n=1 Tax=Williamsia maris TaxID=72806 RepID=A0ABT1HDN7_9NOCA|nr:hypothetical protein [Williamsia maris]MCP2174991.1 hypothetical protein [Williamsia maris]
MSEQRRNSSRLVYDPQSGLSIDLAGLRRHSSAERTTDPENDPRMSEDSRAET